MSDPNEQPGVDTVPLGGGRTAIRFYGFPTSSAELQEAHRVWIRRWVRRRYRSNSRYDIIGMASNLRWRTGNSAEQNAAISLARAREVEQFAMACMVRFIAQERGGRDVVLPEFEVRVVGVGTAYSDPTDEVDAEGHRAVLLIEDAPVLLPGMEIRPAIPGLAEHDRFWIKCCGSVSGGELLTGTLASFAIRDSDNWWQKYFFASGGIGIGAPLSVGDPLSPGDGWVEFRSRPEMRVDSFSGWAQMAGAGAVIGGGVSLAALTFGMGKGPRRRGLATSCRAEVQTNGFTLGAGADYAGALFRGDMQPENSRGWRYL